MCGHCSVPLCVHPCFSWYDTMKNAHHNCSNDEGYHIHKMVPVEEKSPKREAQNVASWPFLYPTMLYIGPSGVANHRVESICCMGRAVRGGRGKQVRGDKNSERMAVVAERDGRERRVSEKKELPRGVGQLVYGRMRVRRLRRWLVRQVEVLESKRVAERKAGVSGHEVGIEMTKLIVKS